MLSFTGMKLGMFLSFVIGHSFHKGALRPDVQTMRRIESERLDRERSWQSDGQDESLESMFKIIGPLKNLAETAGHLAENSQIPVAPGIPERSILEAKLTKTPKRKTKSIVPTETTLAEKPTPAQTPPLKKMTLFFDDTVDYQAPDRY